MIRFNLVFKFILFLILLSSSFSLWQLLFHNFRKWRFLQNWFFKKCIIIFKFAFPSPSFLFWRILSCPFFSSFRSKYFFNILYHYNTNFLFRIFNVTWWIWSIRVRVFPIEIIILITILFFRLLFSLILKLIWNMLWFRFFRRKLIFKLTFIFFGTVTPCNRWLLIII